MIVLEQILSNRNLLIVLASVTAIGFSAGMVGTIAVYKKQSILTGALSNAVFIGVLVSYFTSNSGNIYVAYSVSSVTALLCVFVIRQIVRNSSLKSAQVESFTMSFYFALGLTLFTYIQRNMQSSVTIGLERLLFGELYAMLESEALAAIYVSIAVVVLLFIFLKRYKLILVDKDYAVSLGVNVGFYNILFLFMLVSIIVVGLQAIGAILMSGIFIAPAVCAKQWTQRLLPMVLISAIIGGLSALLGGILSSFNGLIPSGPSIVAIASVVAMVSIFVAPKRGILWRKHNVMSVIEHKKAD